MGAPTKPPLDENAPGRGWPPLQAAPDNDELAVFKNAAEFQGAMFFRGAPGFDSKPDFQGPELVAQ
jgi:hypothetical protein